MSNSTSLDFKISLPTSGPLTLDYLRSINFKISLPGSSPLTLDYLRANPIVQKYAAASSDNIAISAIEDVSELVQICKIICGGE